MQDEGNEMNDNSRMAEKIRGDEETTRVGCGFSPSEYGHQHIHDILAAVRLTPSFD